MRLAKKQQTYWERSQAKRTWNKRENLEQENALKKALETLKPSSTVLFGCGYGRNFYLFKKSFVLGIDFSRNVLKRAKGKKKEIALMDIRKVGLRNRSFDAVITCTVLQHLPPKHLQKVILEMTRIAKKNIICIERKFSIEYRIPNFIPLVLNSITKQGFLLTLKKKVNGHFILIFKRNPIKNEVKPHNIPQNRKSNPKKDKGKKINKKERENLKKLIEIFNDLKIPYFLRGGTLLGVIRDKDFPVGDRDCDIGILSEDYFPKEKALLKRLKVAFSNLEVNRKSKYVYKIRVRKSWSNRLKKGLDIQIFFKSGNYRIKFWPGRGHSKFSASLFKPLKTINFLDLEVSIPYKSEEFLKEQYGNWKVKKPNFHERQGPGFSLRDFKGSLEYFSQKKKKEGKKK